jgi:hypothetical protein
VSPTRYSDEITDPKTDKRHYVGMTSPASIIARQLRMKVRTVEISGHCASDTVNWFAHWRGPLMDGKVKINGEPPDLAIVANQEEHVFFLTELMTPSRA